jgi:hypothetical protein
VLLALLKFEPVFFDLAAVVLIIPSSD